MTQPDSDTFTLQDGRTLAFTSAGRSDGKPIVYFHGAPGSRLEGGPDSLFVDDLAAAGIRLVAFDRPGYGASTPYPRRRVIDVAEDFGELLDHLGIDRAGVVGWSAGGPHALATAFANPCRVTAVGVIAGLAPLRDVGLEGVGERTLYERAQRNETRFRAEVAELATLMAADPLAAILSLLEGVLTEADIAYAAKPAFSNIMMLSMREAARCDLAGYADDILAVHQDWGFPLDEVRRPVRILHGHDDLLVPATHGRYLAGELPNATYKEVEAGHLSVLQGFVALVQDLAVRPGHTQD